MRERGEKRITAEIMAPNSPNFKENKNLYTQETQRMSSRINLKYIHQDTLQSNTQRKESLKQQEKNSSSNARDPN